MLSVCNQWGDSETGTSLIRPPSLTMRRRPCSKVATHVQDSATSSIQPAVFMFTSCCLSASIVYNAFMYWEFVDGEYDAGLVVGPWEGMITASHALI